MRKSYDIVRNIWSKLHSVWRELKNSRMITVLWQAFHEESEAVEQAGQALLDYSPQNCQYYRIETNYKYVITDSECDVPKKVISIPCLNDAINYATTSYKEGEDYDISRWDGMHGESDHARIVFRTGKITGGEHTLYAPNVQIETDLMERYFNDGYLDIDFTGYRGYLPYFTAKHIKHVICALWHCAKHGPNKYNLDIVAQVLHGAKFAPYPCLIEVWDQSQEVAWWDEVIPEDRWAWYRIYKLTFDIPVIVTAEKVIMYDGTPVTPEIIEGSVLVKDNRMYLPNEPETYPAGTYALKSHAAYLSSITESLIAVNRAEREAEPSIGLTLPVVADDKAGQIVPAYTPLEKYVEVVSWEDGLEDSVNKWQKAHYGKEVDIYHPKSYSGSAIVLEGIGLGIEDETILYLQYLYTSLAGEVTQIEDTVKVLTSTESGGNTTLNIDRTLDTANMKFIKIVVIPAKVIMGNYNIPSIQTRPDSSGLTILNMGAVDSQIVEVGETVLVHNGRQGDMYVVAEVDAEDVANIRVIVDGVVGVAVVDQDPRRRGMAARTTDKWQLVTMGNMEKHHKVLCYDKLIMPYYCEYPLERGMLGRTLSLNNQVVLSLSSVKLGADGGNTIVAKLGQAIVGRHYYREEKIRYSAYLMQVRNRQTIAGNWVKHFMDADPKLISDAVANEWLHMCRENVDKFLNDYLPASYEHKSITKATPFKDEEQWGQLYSITVLVTDGQEPINGATVTITVAGEADAKETDEAGTALFTLQDGEYVGEVVAEGYSPAVINFTVAGAAKTVTVSLTLGG